MDTVPKKKTVSVNFTHAMFSVFDFLTLVLKRPQGVSTLGCIISQKSADLTRQFGEADLGLAVRGQFQSDLVCHFICELKTTSQI